MLKIFIQVLFISCLIFIAFFSVNGEVINNTQLDPAYILTDSQLDLSVDNKKSKYTAVNQHNVLYIDSKFFKTNFREYKKLVKEIDIYGGSLVKDMSGKEIECVPLYYTLNALNVAYTYNAVYGKAVIIIRTDVEVPPQYAASPEPVPEETGGLSISYMGGSSGNYPTSSVKNTDDYPGYYDGANATGAVPNYNDTTVPPGYGYYTPPGHQPGYSFGDYGNVVQDPAPPNVYQGLDY